MVCDKKRFWIVALALLAAVSCGRKATDTDVLAEQTYRSEAMGRAMKAFPYWFLKGEPRPEKGRKTFNIWYYYRKDSPLQPAGLVGPVQLMTYE